MKLLAQSLPFFLATAAASQNFYRPNRLAYQDLVRNDSVARAKLLDAMTSVGMIVITSVPQDNLNTDELNWDFLECVNNQVEGKEALSHVFSDGTIRTTLASHSVAGPGGMQNIFHVEDGVSKACQSFAKESKILRQSMADVTDVFASRLSLAVKMNSPLLFTKDNYNFDSFQDVVENGDHLEHFHSYQRVHPSNDLLKSSEESVNTIDFHTDQGMFIVFTPGRLVENKSSVLSSGFYIELPCGKRSEVSFEHGDDLVIMLGDGVNSIVNSKIIDKSHQLRAVPHSLIMPDIGDETFSSRVWYGRMVLPPSLAVHKDHGMTYGDLREMMIGGTDEDKKKGLDLGCSGSSSLVARQLEEVVCEGNSLYCWHRCMNATEFGVSANICASRALELGQAQDNYKLKCINPRGQVYVEGHGDFYPSCTSGVELATEYPPLPGLPQDEEKCDINAWEAFSASTGYDHVFDRLGDNRGNRGYWEGADKKGGNVTKFMWNVVGDEVQGKVVFNGLFGYLAIGFAKKGGKKNGMNGASIIMAVPGGNYSSKFGLDLSMDDNVQEYVISTDQSSFRHWSDPIPGVDTSSYKVVSTDCFTEMTFQTDSINGISFNVSGTDDLVWAGNKEDYFCGSHGRGRPGEGDRDHFVVDWGAGKAWYPEEMTVDHGHDGHDHNDDGMTSSLSDGKSTAAFVTASTQILGTTIGVVSILGML